MLKFPSDKKGENMRTKVVKCYIWFILGVFPLLMNNGFVDISKTKSNIFLFATGVLLISCLFGTALEKDWELFLAKRNWLIYAVMIVITISTLGASNIRWAISGEMGRYQGALVYYAYCIAALCILNFGRMEKSYLDVLLVSSILLNLLACLNFYEVDPLRTLAGIKEYHRHAYISSLGNINLYSAYLSIITPVAIVNYITEKENKKSLLYLTSLIFCYAGMMVSMCDSAYIILGVLFVALPFWCLESYERRKRMSQALVLFGIVLLVLVFVNYKLIYPLEYVTGILLHFSDLTFCVGILVGFCVVDILFYLTKRITGNINEKTWRRSWLCLISLVGVTVVYFYIKNTTFDGTWGSLRGFIWSQGCDFYFKQGIWQKLFGVGLDMIYPAFSSFYGQESIQIYGANYDNLHNEYLQYLVTVGIVGLLVYLISMGCILYQIAKNAREDDMSLAIGMAGICYVVQAFANISMTSVTPVIMTLLFAGLIINYKNLHNKRRKKL